jgi:hypothetical protein
MPPKKVKLIDSEKIGSEVTYKEFMKEWLDICEHLDENAKCIKPIKDRKQKLELLLQTYMSENEIGSCQSNNTFIKIENKQTMPAMNKSVIEKGAQMFFDNLETDDTASTISSFSAVSNKSSKEIATEFVKFIYNIQEPVEKSDLKRIRL